MREQTIFVTNNLKNFLNENHLKRIYLDSKSVNHIRKTANIKDPLVVCDGVAYICDTATLKHIKKIKLKKGDRHYE